MLSYFRTPKGKNRKILSWFTQYFEDNFPEESAIGFQEFSKALDDDEVSNSYRTQGRVYCEEKRGTELFKDEIKITF